MIIRKEKENVMELVKSNIIYNGPRFQIESAIYEDTDHKQCVRDHVIAPAASVILAITKDGNVLFVKQQRTATGNNVELELPAGLIEEGETPLNGAIRELKEETGYFSSNIKFLTSYYSSNGYSNEKVYLFLAEGLTDKGEQSLDETEEIEVLEIPLPKAIEMLRENQFANGHTMMALLWYKAFLQ